MLPMFAGLTSTTALYDFRGQTKTANAHKTENNLPYCIWTLRTESSQLFGPLVVLLATRADLLHELSLYSKRSDNEDVSVGFSRTPLSAAQASEKSAATIDTGAVAPMTARQGLTQFRI